MLTRKHALVFFLGWLAVAPLAAQEPPEPEKKPNAPHGRVVLITFDAFRPETYREDRWPMPNLKALAARGVQARKVTGIFPTLTYPSHTTIVTGVRSARHGIYSNWLFDPKDGGKRWYAEAAHLRATPLWDMAKRGGVSTAAIHWPVTVGATIDWHIPEIVAKGNDDAIDLMRKAGTPGLLDEVWPKEVKATGEAGTDECSTAATCAIIEKHKPELLLLHLLQSDGAQHHAGREDPSVIAAFAKLDEHLGSILHSLEVAGVLSDTNVIVTGDHSMMDVHTAVKPNALLRELGYLKTDAKGKFTDWVACANTGGASAAVYARDPSDKVTNDRIVAQLKSAAESHYRGMFNILDREALDREESFPGAICAFEGEPGYSMESEATGGVLGVAHLRGNHGYMPTRDEVCAGFVAAGPGLAQARSIPALRQIDIAPLCAHLLGVETGPGVEGVLVPGILAPRAHQRVDDH